MIVKNIYFITWMLFISIVNGNSRIERSINYPTASLLGLFMAIAIPIDLPDQNVFISYNFEGNYHLPENYQEYGDMAFLAPITQVSRQGRSIDRRLAYTMLEEMFTKYELDGRACLLRSICEVAEIPIDHHGLIGSLFHVLFTPSTSKDEGLPAAFYLAEKGGCKGNCTKYIQNCPNGFLDLISTVLEHV